MTKKLICTIGLPRSGKSTWAMMQNHPVVDPDSIRLALHGQAFVPEAEPMVWTMAEYMIKALLITGHDTVILDCVNHTKRRRNKWVNFCKQNKWDIDWHREFTSKDVCIKRAIDCGNPGLVPVIERMAKEMDI